MSVQHFALLGGPRLNAPSRATHPVPSGQNVELFEVLIDQVGVESWLRFRFLAPQIGKLAGDLTFSDTEDDFIYLCSDVVLPYMQNFALEADVVVITLLDRAVEFGASDHDATQYIETFRVAGGSCEVEGLW